MRKIIAFDSETYDALQLLARDRMSSLQELSEEAFRDLLKKHGRPSSLKDALNRSLAQGAGKARTKRPLRKTERRSQRAD